MLGIWYAAYQIHHLGKIKTSGSRDRSLYLKDLYAISKLWMKYEFILWQIFIKIFEQFQIVLPNGDVWRQIQKFDLKFRS